MADDIQTTEEPKTPGPRSKSPQLTEVAVEVRVKLASEEEEETGVDDTTKTGREGHGRVDIPDTPS